MYPISKEQIFQADAAWGILGGRKMKTVRIFSDGKKTYAQIIYNTQKFDVIYEKGRNVLFNPVLDSVKEKICSAPPTLSSVPMKNLINLLEAVDAALHTDTEGLVVTAPLHISHPEDLYAKDALLENQWKRER